MFKGIIIERKPTGRFFTANIGPKQGQTGEEVHSWGWGGIDLRFIDGEVITYANGDVTPVESLGIDMDKVAYDTLKQLNPELLGVIRNQLALGLSAEQIETGLRFRYGTSMVANAAIGAAHYLAAGREEPDVNLQD